MKKLPILLAALFLPGCATIAQKPHTAAHHYKAPVVKAAPAAPPPVVLPQQPAPQAPATFKQRWYSRFKVHPKWFH